MGSKLDLVPETDVRQGGPPLTEVGVLNVLLLFAWPCVIFLVGLDRMR